MDYKIFYLNGAHGINALKGKTMTRLRKANEIVLSVCMVLCIGLTVSVFFEAVRIPTEVWVLVLIVGSISFVTRAILMKKMGIAGR